MKCWTGISDSGGGSGSVSYSKFLQRQKQVCRESAEMKGNLMSSTCVFLNWLTALIVYADLDLIWENCINGEDLKLSTGSKVSLPGSFPHFRRKETQ